MIYQISDLSVIYQILSVIINFCVIGYHTKVYEDRKREQNMKQLLRFIKSVEIRISN